MMIPGSGTPGEETARRASAVFVAVTVAVTSVHVEAAAPTGAIDATAADQPADRAIDPAVPTAISSQSPPAPPVPDPRAWHDAALRAEVQQLRAEVADLSSESEDEGEDDEDEDDEDEGPPRGVGMMIAGGALLGPGTLVWTTFGLLLSGGFCLAHCVDETDSGQQSNPGVALFVVAGLSAATGIGLLVGGAHRNSVYRAWKRERMTRAPERRLHVGAGGLSLRF